LNYLKESGRGESSIREKAERFIHLGYQRLLTFESSGGGFSWYGRGPAHTRLSAFGLMQLHDLARVYPVDDRLRDRTRRWLLSRRLPDGSWDEEGQRFSRENSHPRLASTAYAAIAVFGDGPSDNPGPTLEFILRHAPDSIQSPYVLALTCRALLAMNAAESRVRPFLDSLESLVQRLDGGRLACWRNTEHSTIFHGAGTAGDVETTAQAVLALSAARRERLVGPALAWLAERRQGGHWGSTQATVLALKALSLIPIVPINGPRTIEVRLNGQVVHTIDIEPNQADVVRQVELTRHLRPEADRLEIRGPNGGGISYQLELRSNVLIPVGGDSPFAVKLDRDRNATPLGERTAVKVTVENRSKTASNMVMLSVPIPAGFQLDRDDWDLLVRNQTIDRFEANVSEIRAYVRSLSPGQPLTIPFHLRAVAACDVQSGPPRIWEYYNPERIAYGASARWSVPSASRD
jgi:hypothetical protein